MRETRLKVVLLLKNETFFSFSLCFLQQNAKTFVYEEKNWVRLITNSDD